jgi:hypothetical protein
MTQVASNIIFAEDATENLCRYMDCQNTQTENKSSGSLDSDTTTAIGSAKPEAEQGLVLLDTQPASAHYDSEIAQQSMIRHESTITAEARNEIGASASNYEDNEYYVHLSRGCSRMIEVQQMSCTLAKTLLQYPAQESVCTSDPKLHAPAQRSPTERESMETSSSTETSPETLQTKRDRIAGDAEKHVQHFDGALDHRIDPENRTSIEHEYKQNTDASISGDTLPVEFLSESRVERSLLSKRKEEEDKRFERLEQLLISQQEAKIEREKAKNRAQEAEAQANAQAKKQGDADNLEKLEKLVLAQKEEQLKREQAAEATRKAEADARETARTSVPILFEDAIGRRFSCPWQSCKTWKVYIVKFSITFMLANYNREWRSSYIKSVLVWK